ncbi:MAG: 4-hydroxyacetophenone monooxygenase [Solirubrobacterales bacterium]|nr:4-hydroxyacetophenone monooxygenase [Solirubrobacterales bacterium]
MSEAAGGIVTPVSAALAASAAELDDVLARAHIPTLLMSLVHLTGETRWLEPPYTPQRPRGSQDHDDGGLSPEALEDVLRAARDALLGWRTEGRRTSVPAREVLVRMMSVCVGESVADEYVEMACEEIGLTDRDATWSPRRTVGRREEVEVLIVGAGFSGLCMAIKLERARIPYRILEKNPELGGTWLENAYPGCAVDSPSHLYQFSFEQQADWPRYYSRRADIRAYLEHCARKYGVLENITFGTAVLDAAWDEEDARWVVRTRAGDGVVEELTARVFVPAVGQLNRPALPDIPGMDDFDGRAAHTALWPDDLDVAGLRVAVIGTGASAMQLVPAIAGVAAHVTVFQRSPQWAVPNADLGREVSPEVQWLLANVPFYSGWFRFRQFWLWNDNVWPTLQIDPDWPDQHRSINPQNEQHRRFLTRHMQERLAAAPELLEHCVPDYPPYGKRMLMDAGWYDALVRDDVALETGTIERINAGGVRTADGTDHAFDVLVYATGFHARRLIWPMEVRGREGRTLRELWGDDDATAHLGITVPGFPNLFTLYGPNTNLGHGGSVVFHAELQVRYVMGMLRAMLDRDLEAVEVRQDVHDDYVRRVDEAHDRMIWSHEGAKNWYRNAAGRVVTNSPWRLVDYWSMTRRPDLAEYHVRTAPAAAPDAG